MSTRSIEHLEARRLVIQCELDLQKSQTARNKLGQFATPNKLAQELLEYLREHHVNDEKVKFLDPAIGTGSFYSALRSTFPLEQISGATGYEIDPHYGTPTAELWKGELLDYRFGDFLRANPEPIYNLLVCNPPYVRHHHISNDDKDRLKGVASQSFGTRLSGLAGLYCYFLARSHEWMSDGGVAAWLIPSEFMDVNYGAAVKHFLLHQVSLLHIHRFDPNDAQFTDAIVSSAVVIFKKERPRADHHVRFSFGGPLNMPTTERSVAINDLAKEPKWTRFPVLTVREHGLEPVISDFFRITRGIATGDNHFFILRDEEIVLRELPIQAFRPILPSPRHLDIDEIEALENGHPNIDRKLHLLDPQMSEDEIAKNHPTLHAYLEEGKNKGLHERYLTSRRRPWFSQEKRDPAPIICTYLGRSDKKNGRPFRFILNRSKAVMANVYLGMYPKPALAIAMRDDPELIVKIWRILNSIPAEKLLGEGRVYGGGLHKLEPKELSNVAVPEIAALLSTNVLPHRQFEAFELEAAE